MVSFSSDGGSTWHLCTESTCLGIYDGYRHKYSKYMTGQSRKSSKLIRNEQNFAVSEELFGKSGLPHDLRRIR